MNRNAFSSPAFHQRGAVLFVATIILLWRFRKLQEPVIVATAALIGVAVFPLYHLYAH